MAVVDLDVTAAEAVSARLPWVHRDRRRRRRVVSRAADGRSGQTRLGPIDLYCSNAGVGTGRQLGEDEATGSAPGGCTAWLTCYAARALLPEMTARGSGVMVITASAAGLLMMMQSAPYTVTKHASVAIAEWLAVNYGGQGLQFHCLCPQGVRTPMVSTDAGGEAEVVASGRILEPAEVADAVLDAIQANRFLVLPHPEVHEFEQMKVADRDRWLAGMRRLLARISR